jgi:hypothetical protein
LTVRAARKVSWVATGEASGLAVRGARRVLGVTTEDGVAKVGAAFDEGRCLGWSLVTEASRVGERYRGKRAMWSSRSISMNTEGLGSVLEEATCNCSSIPRN